MVLSTKSKVRWLVPSIIIIVLIVLSVLHFSNQIHQQGIHINERHNSSNFDVISTEESTDKNDNNTNKESQQSIHTNERHNSSNFDVISTEEVKEENYTNNATESTTWRCENSNYTGNTTITSVALLKVHKTGSSTVASILYRFGVRRGLSFIMTKQYHQYWPNTIDKSYKTFYPACKQNKYDILNIHSRYNGRDVLTQYMHKDTYVIAPLRHPMDQLLSGMNYYGYVNKLRRMGKTIEDFLDNPHYLTNDYTAKLLTWNPMSYVIGLNDFNIPSGMKKSALKSDLKYTKEIERFLNWTEENIDFFMISEKFDESLILLKDRLGWRIEDMIYFSLNTAANPPERNNVDTDTLLIKTKEFSYIDYLLYERMKVKLDRMIEEKGDELEVEVSKLRSLNKEFSEYCLERVEVDSRLYGSVKILSNILRDDREDNRCCVETRFNEMEYVSEIKNYMKNSCRVN